MSVYFKSNPQRVASSRVSFNTSEIHMSGRGKPPRGHIGHIAFAGRLRMMLMDFHQLITIVINYGIRY